MAESTKVAPRRSFIREVWETIVVLVEALLIAFVFRSFAYQPFSIPSGSMESTLLIGDYIVANKWYWGYSHYSTAITGNLFGVDFDVLGLPLSNRVLAWGEPQRGDIAVFRPVTKKEDYVKRIVGMPGDRIKMTNGRLYINGVLVDRQMIGTVVDTNGFRVTLYTETLPNGVKHLIQEQTDGGPLDNTAEFVVPAASYFMMGDNRDNSADSRVPLGNPDYIGPAPVGNLIGKAEARFFSIKDNLPAWQLWNWPANVRWDRMFQSVYQ